MSNENQLIDNEIVDSSEWADVHSSRIGRNRILNDSSVFYKGLFGMILCIAPAAIVGLVLVKISLEQAKVALNEYKEKPSFYKLSSIKRIKQGRIFAYIGLSLFILEIVALVTYMSIN